MTPQEKLRLLRLIESLEGPASSHLHALFFRHLKPARAWNPATRTARSPTEVGTRIESARRRLSSMQRRGEVEHFIWGRSGAGRRSGCRAVAVFLTPLAYAVYGSRLLLQEPPTPSSGLARRSWQRGELWSALAELGATCVAGRETAPNRAPSTVPYDVVSHRGKQAILLVDDPSMSCDALVESIPPPSDPKTRQNVMVVPGLDGSVWDASSGTWWAKGMRLQETLYLLGQRGDCALWGPRQLAGVGALAVKDRKPNLTPEPADRHVPREPAGSVGASA